MVKTACALGEAAYHGGTYPFSALTMDHEFLTIKAATQRYVVSEVTLRRLAREITREDGHEFRDYVRPGAAEMKELRLEKRPFEYELSTQLLGVRYKEQKAETEEGSGDVEDVKSDTGSGAVDVLESTNDLLREQLKVKDDQIRQLNESLRSFQQQQNATNMLLVRLSERMPMLNEGATIDAEEVKNDSDEKATATPTARAEKTEVRKSVKVAAKSKATKPKRKSRGVLDRMLRPEFWRETVKTGGRK